jgi:hypothetical protein
MSGASMANANDDFTDIEAEVSPKKKPNILLYVVVALLLVGLICLILWAVGVFDKPSGGISPATSASTVNTNGNTSNQTGNTGTTGTADTTGTTTGTTSTTGTTTGTTGGTTAAITAIVAEETGMKQATIGPDPPTTDTTAATSTTSTPPPEIVPASTLPLGEPVQATETPTTASMVQTATNAVTTAVTSVAETVASGIITLGSMVGLSTSWQSDGSDGGAWPMQPIYFDRQNVDCGADGAGISSLSLERDPVKRQIRYNLQCQKYVKDGTPFVPTVIPQKTGFMNFGNISGGDPRRLTDHPVDCGPDGYINQFQLRNDYTINGGSWAYQYKCAMPGFPLKCQTQTTSFVPIACSDPTKPCNNMDGIQNLKPVCQSGQVMNKLRLVNSADNKMFAYEYSCCDAPVSTSTTTLTTG